MLDSFLSVLAPHSCCGCGKLGNILCLSCKNDIIYEPYSQCIECFRPSSSNDLCSGCQKTLNVAAAWCVGSRDDVLKHLLAKYKFSSAQAVSAVCVQLLDDTIPFLPPDIVVVPVPTSPGHRRVRGFDHIERVSAPLAELRQLKHMKLLRRYGSDTQHFKTKSERIATASRGLEIHSNSPKMVLLVDDIYTTGATIRACVALLRSAGAEQVFVAIIARQPIDEKPDL